MKSIEKKICSRIYKRGRGWVFSSSDFVDEFGVDNVKVALHSLSNQQVFIRLIRGLYYYPKFSKVLNKILSPDIDQIANALARKFNWRIEPSGDTALNVFGLSTQVPGRYVYLSNGPDRKYEIGNNSIEFKKVVLKDIGFKYKESRLIVSALKSLGEKHVTKEVIEKIKNYIDRSMYKKIVKDTKTSTIWIYEIVKQICRTDSEDG